MSNFELVQYLADGYTIPQISQQTNIKIKTLEAKIAILKVRAFSKTSAHLVATYLRKELID